MPVFPTPSPAYPFNYGSPTGEGKPYIQQVPLTGLTWTSDLTATVNLASASWAAASRFAGGNAVAVMNRPGLSLIQSMFIDNSRCIGSVTITFPDTGFVVTTPGLTQQWVNVMTELTIFSIRISSSLAIPTIYACNTTVYPSTQTAATPLVQLRSFVFTSVNTGGTSVVTTNNYNSTVITFPTIGATYTWSDTLGNSGDTSLGVAQSAFFDFSTSTCVPISIVASIAGPGGTTTTTQNVLLDAAVLTTSLGGGVSPVTWNAAATDRLAGSRLRLIGNTVAAPPFWQSVAAGTYTATYNVTAQFY